MRLGELFGKTITWPQGIHLSLTCPAVNEKKRARSRPNLPSHSNHRHGLLLSRHFLAYYLSFPVLSS
ncbi:hypothetical protein Nepgr_029308 [Nepenthes gracilis]|uniref:Uncharacterized protein n=1 Tax=Nepenthes gracilis TaxID=150966 RepID=A0AAD3Y4Q8_NEPGR|nr:hypothetical protein Nepgr_029308 [Nepenthes gracilis]